MASPQKENGYTPIAHEIIEHLVHMKMSGTEWQYVMCIFRKTYGFHKKDDWITNSQIVAMTGLKKERVSEAKSRLLQRKIVTEKRNKISIQKDWEQWIELRKSVTFVTEKRNSELRKSVYTKDNTTKDNIPEQSSAQKTMKKNAFNYSENNSSDSYEDVIDIESGQKVVDKKNNASKVYWEMVDWAQTRRGFKFLNIKKQFKAFKTAKDAEVKPSEIQKRWCEFEIDEFWKEKGFDFMDVVNSFNKRR